MTLRDLRKQQGLTLRSAAKKLDCHFTHLSKIENGQDYAGKQLVSRMAKLYGRSERTVAKLSGVQWR